MATSSATERAYEVYYVNALQQRTAAFAWQAFASKVIFWMVLLLVLAGLAFSAVQFAIALRRNSQELPQEIEISLQSIKVKSQFLGVVTLALSLAFFYLYLATVYPIVRVGGGEAATNGAASSPK